MSRFELFGCAGNDAARTGVCWLVAVGVGGEIAAAGSGGYSASETAPFFLVPLLTVFESRGFDFRF